MSFLYFSWFEGEREGEHCSPLAHSPGACSRQGWAGPVQWEARSGLPRGEQGHHLLSLRVCLHGEGRSRVGAGTGTQACCCGAWVSSLLWPWLPFMSLLRITLPIGYKDFFWGWKIREILKKSQQELLQFVLWVCIFIDIPALFSLSAQIKDLGCICYLYCFSSWSAKLNTGSYCRTSCIKKQSVKMFLNVY